MGNHDVWCTCSRHPVFIKCENCIEEERTEEIARQQKAREKEWAKKARMDQFMEDMEDPEFRARVARRLGICAWM